MISQTNFIHSTDRKATSVCLVAVAMLLATRASTRADAGPYVFERIADSTGEIAAMDYGARLNDSGELCFLAGMDSGGEAVYRASVESMTPLALAPADFDGLGAPDINNAGKMVYQALPINGGTGIQYAVGPLTATLYDTYQLDHNISSFGGAMVNDSGRVAFMGYALNVEGLYYSSDMGPQKIIDVSGPLKSLNLQDFQADDQAVIVAELDAGGFALQVVKADGSTRQIADSSGPIDQMGFARMNTAGTVVFTAIMDTGEFAILSGEGGPLETFVDSAGPFAVTYLPVADDAGRVAFFGVLDNGDNGIYLGPDPEADALIASGAELDGSTIASVNYLCDMNARGQIAFTCEMADGRDCLFLASPDRDEDGTPDYRDECPDDSARTAPGLCGCGAEEFDTDGDGQPDACEPAAENNGGANAGDTTPQTTPGGDCCGGGMPAVMPLLLAGMRRRRRPVRRRV